MAYSHNLIVAKFRACRGPGETNKRSRRGIAPPDRTEHWLNQTILGAGLTSAFGDFTYEMTHVILPGFLVEDMADGLSDFTKLGSGYLTDRGGARKSLVMVGSPLTAVHGAGGWSCLAASSVGSAAGPAVAGLLATTFSLYSGYLPLLVAVFVIAGSYIFRFRTLWK